MAADAKIAWDRSRESKRILLGAHADDAMTIRLFGPTVRDHSRDISRTIAHPRIKQPCRAPPSQRLPPPADRPSRAGCVARHRQPTAAPAPCNPRAAAW